MNRELAAFYTTRNPDFVLSNFLRDTVYANSMVWVKESPNYAIAFNRNFAKLNPGRMVMLFDKLRRGALDMENETERMFALFVENGGETGYTNIRDIEKRKKDIVKALKREGQKLSAGKAWKAVGVRLDELNRGVENCARFAAFMTSRQMNRSVDRAIWDAKEISVNFNKKGSGSKFVNATGQTYVGKAAGALSGAGRSLYVFWNAAVQGSVNFGRQAKRHPVKALTGMATMFALGLLAAALGGDDGEEDENAYFNLPEHVRRTNFMVRVGGQWVSIPLPLEYRAVYGLGELAMSRATGHERYRTDGEMAMLVAGQLSQLLPLDVLEGGGDVLSTFMPSAVKPLYEAYVNRSWTGLPIYKDTPYNKEMPEWTKAYRSANRQLVELSQTLNEMSGGDAYTKGAVDINPAQVEHVITGYLGGFASVVDKLVKTGETVAGKREYDPRNILWVNRVVKNGDERTELRAVENEYQRLRKEHDDVMRRMRSYENDTEKGIFDFAEKIDFLNNSPEYGRALIYEDYEKELNLLYKEIKNEPDEEERELLEEELGELKKELVEEARGVGN